MRKFRSIGFVAFMLVAATAGRLALAGQEGSDTPENLLKGMQAAALAGKGADVLAFVHSDDRPLYGFAILFVGAFTPISYMDDQKTAEKLGKDWDALLAKHKIVMSKDEAPLAGDPSEIKMKARLLFKDVDIAAFVTDAMTFIKTNAKKEKGKSDLDELPVPKGTIEGLKIDGDNATSKVDGKDTRFTKVNGRWFIRIDM